MDIAPEGDRITGDVHDNTRDPHHILQVLTSKLQSAPNTPLDQGSLKHPLLVWYRTLQSCVFSLRCTHGNSVHGSCFSSGTEYPCT